MKYKFYSISHPACILNFYNNLDFIFEIYVFRVNEMNHRFIPKNTFNFL